MHNILEIFSNPMVMCGVTAWFVAQAIKIPLYWAVERKWDWRRFFGAGGMPSSHTALVISVTLMIGFLHGFTTPAFSVSLMISSIVMYDATGVRRETGIQGAVINEILRQVLIDGKPISDAELKELVGHKPLEVLAGAVLGMIIAAVFLLF